MRLFIGIDLPPEAKQQLSHFQSELKKLGVSGYWKSTDNFHLTLEFLGETEAAAVKKLGAAMISAARGKKPFSLYLEGIGGFPSLWRPHTLWTAVKGDIQDLTVLQKDLHQALLQSGFSLENRPYKPHLTLASRPVLGNSDLASLQSNKLAKFTVKEIVLFESAVIRGKRTYSGLVKTPLGE